MRIADGGHHAAGHRAGVHAQLGVHGHHDHVEPCQQLRFLVQRTVLQDVALDAGEQPERRPARIQPRHRLQLLAQPLRRQTPGHGQPGGVVGQGRPLVAEQRRGAPHLLDRTAPVGPVRMGVAVAAQQRPQFRAGPVGRRPRGLLLQRAQIAGHLPCQGLPHHLRGLRADPLQRLQRSGRRAPGDLALGQGREHPGGGTEGPDPVGGCQRPFQQEGDPVQGGDGIHGHLRLVTPLQGSPALPAPHAHRTRARPCAPRGTWMCIRDSCVTTPGRAAIGALLDRPRGRVVGPGCVLRSIP